MPAISPIDVTDSTLRCTIKSNGQCIKDEYPILSIFVKHEINRISYAEIRIVDGNISNNDFPIMDSQDFVPGNEIEILAGYGSERELSIFTGLIVKQGLHITAGKAPTLVVTCKHKVVQMSINNTEKQFSHKTDSDIIESIIGNYGLLFFVDSTPTASPFIFQKSLTDWDFILSRAALNGFVITTDNDKIIVGKPNINAMPVLRVAYGQSMLMFEASLSAEKQIPSLEVSSWNFKHQTLQTSKAKEPTVNTQGNLSAQSLATALGQKSEHFIFNAPLSTQDLAVRADATLSAIRYAALTGTVSFMGNALAKPNTLIELAGVGNRFSGNAYVSKVNHVIENGNWTTKVKFGLDPKKTFENKNTSYPLFVGELPDIHGLQIGKVKKISEDPDNQFRILVSLITQPKNEEGIWARMANFYATKNAGSFFLPEIGDEVLLGFIEGDAGYPIILGSMYSTAQPAATAPDEGNSIKSLITKSQLKITFDDERKILKLETPEKNTIMLSDDAQSIELADQHANFIKLNANGISIQSSKNISFQSQGNISLKAMQNIDLASTNDIRISGLNITHDAQIAYVAKGNASAELSASGEIIVKGALVKIN